MAAPLVGICTGLRGDEQVIERSYIEAVEAAGATPVLLPMCADESALQPLLQAIGGLLIPGGPGISDRLVGDLPPDLPPVDPLRRRNEIQAYEAMRSRGRPLLGICYGMQFINARCGGSIFADAQEAVGVGAHSPKRNGGDPVFHPVGVEGGTCLGAAVGAGPHEANSYHLQAVDEVGAGLRVNARSADGLVEGVESADGRMLGVQFHPERMPDSVWAALFTDLVEKAAR